jgi:hypothetical protein
MYRCAAATTRGWKSLRANSRAAKSGQDIVNLPKIKVTNFLIFTKPLGDGQIVVSVKGGSDF